MEIVKRKLGLGPELSEIGLGTWAIGGSWKFGWGHQDEFVSVKTIEKALETGINWIDTAPAYGLGLSEEILGRVLKTKRDDFFISTKCAIIWNDHRKVSFDMSPENIRKECESSLRRLQTDYIDLYQIHWPDNKTLVENSWKEMLSLKKEGKVIHIGVSNFDLKQIKRCEKIGHVEFVQMPYSLLRREVEEEILHWCDKNSAGFLAYSPMQSGLLTGKFNKGYINSLGEGDWRKRDSLFKDPMFTKILEFVESLKPISKNLGKSLSALAVAWVLEHKEVTSAIVGVRSVEQAIDLTQGSGWKIPPDVMNEIEKISERFL
jgi:aryl-alcohol dehydrogenase-like predicted oxidoreductase